MTAEPGHDRSSSGASTADGGADAAAGSRAPSRTSSLTSRPPLWSPVPLGTVTETASHINGRNTAPAWAERQRARGRTSAGDPSTLQANGSRQSSNLGSGTRRQTASSSGLIAGISFATNASLNCGLNCRVMTGGDVWCDRGFDSDF